jgi:sterol desaturase/sphingolipid hydroxylase (fatty acid hydroxylase superfamily)
MKELEDFIQTKAGLYVVFWVLFCIFIEIIITLYKNKNINANERFSSITIALIGPFLAGKIIYILLLNGLYIYVYEKYGLFSFPLNKWWTWVLFILAADFCTYIIHSIEHKVRFFWCSHEVHHSAKHLTVETSLRTSPIAAIYASFMRLILPFLGFHPILHHLETLFSIAWGAANHNIHIRKSKFLDLLFNTTANHRVHHSSDVECLDKNFSSYFMIWDHIFGTYHAENKVLTFGLTVNRETNNPIKLIYQPYRDLWNDIKSAKDFKTGLKYFFYPPGWHPDASKNTTATTLQNKNF